jgi:hypothetical protein
MSNKFEEARTIVEEMQKNLELSKVEELVKDNKIEFEYKEETYRVRLLNLKEKEELELLRRKKFGQLIMDKDILLSKDLKEQLKQRGMNIDDIDIQTDRLEAEYKEVSLQLGESISKNEGESILKAYEEKLNILKLAKDTLFTQKLLLLNDSLENHLESYVYQVVTYLSLDKKVNEKWERKFKTFDEFQTYEDQDLITKAGQFSILLQYI